jgi:uncharacterized membrane protein YphA (DoxX/SURF4 family)
MSTIRNFARFIIAPVFIFSGFVKAIDPLGYTYKITDYFEAFGMHFMIPLALPLAIFFSTSELVIGFSLVLGILMRITSWLLMVFMSFFTILTLIIALTNPVSDCGCFGDALILTNWQTFWKNIIFLLPTLVIFFNRRMFKPFTSTGSEWGIALLFILIGIFLSVTAYRNLPFIDFRPYKVGTDIPKAMEIPDDAEMDEYESVFVYSKDGQTREFSEEELIEILKDTSWKYVDRITKLIKKGYEPPIHDFTITSLDGHDITDSVLFKTKYSLLVVAYDLNKANSRGLHQIEDFTASLSELGVSVFGLTSSTNHEIETVGLNHDFVFDFYTTDEITLKTMIRTNPGVVLLKDGTIIGKWHFRNLPSVDGANSNILSLALENNLMVHKEWVIAFFISLFLTIMFFLLIIVDKTTL